jgi:hypothetical protein
MLARHNHFEKTFLKKVIVKDAEPKPPQEKVNVFEPKEAAKMVTIFRRSSLGNNRRLASLYPGCVRRRQSEVGKSGDHATGTTAATATATYHQRGDCY